MTEARIRISATDATGGPIASAQARLAALARESDGVQTRFQGLAAAASTAFAGAGVAGFLVSAVQGLDRLNDLRDATGASIERLSALEQVAARTGTSFDTVGQALTKFNAALSAKDDSDIGRTIQALGLSLAELRAQDPAEAFVATARAFDRFAKDGATARAQTELFGRSLREIAPLLADTASASDLTATATAEQAQQAERLLQQFSRLRANVDLLGRAAAVELLPALNEVAAALAGVGSDGAQSSGKLAVLRETFEALAVLGANVAFVMRQIGNEIGAHYAKSKALLELDFRGWAVISVAVREDAERARRELDAFERRVLAKPLTPTIQGADFSDRSRARVGAPGLSVPDGGKTKTAVSEFQRYIAALRDAAFATLNLSREEQTRVDIALGKLGKLSDKQREQALQAARLVDDLKNRGDPLGDFIDKAARDARQRDVDTVLALASDSAAAKFEALGRETALVIDEFQRGNITAETFARAMETLKKKGDELLPKLEELKEATSTFAEQAARNIQDALGDTLLRVMEGNFKSIGRLWLDLLKRMAAQAAAAKIAEKLFGPGNKGGGLLDGLLKLLPLGGGGAPQNLNLSDYGGAFGGGGFLGAGRWGIAGERGPEIIRGPAQVVPMAAAPAGPTIIVQGDVGARALRAINLALQQFEARRALRERS